jgi:hypothetical protein
MDHPNPFMHTAWLECQEEIEFLKDRLEDYQSQKDIIGASDVEMFLEEAINDLKSIEIAGGAPLVECVQ